MAINKDFRRSPMSNFFGIGNGVGSNGSDARMSGVFSNRAGRTEADSVRDNATCDGDCVSYNAANVAAAQNKVQDTYIRSVAKADAQIAAANAAKTAAATTRNTALAECTPDKILAKCTASCSPRTGKTRM